DYHRSIRLGLTHYMGSVQRARTMIHQGNERRLYSGKNRAQWPGALTWLHLVFNRPLCVFGLALQENEVFLRWLLIERAKYFRQFPERRKQAYYVTTDEGAVPTVDKGKLRFLEGVGFHLVHVRDYAALYGQAWQ